jgi:hypothetical protein
MTNVNTVRKTTAAALAFGIVLFSFAGLDSTLNPQHYAATETSAQAVA